MRALLSIVVGAVVLALGCTSGTSPTDPASSAAASSTSRLAFGDDDRDRTDDAREDLVRMLDKCDPVTFQAAGIPCVGNGTVTLDEFIAELSATQTVLTWRFAPRRPEVVSGEALNVVNRGGEDHTFTRVRRFGGGIVPFLNDLAGVPEVAPECTRLKASDFLAPGSRISLPTGLYVPLSPGEHRFMCCIHPWMKANVEVED